MTKLWYGLKVVFLAAMFVSINVVTFYSTGLEVIQSKVIKRDARGRVEVMEVRAAGDICMAEITYEYRWPQIHIVVLSRNAGVWKLGTLEFENETKESLSDAALMDGFSIALEFCLPLIVPGYARV